MRTDRITDLRSIAMLVALLFATGCGASGGPTAPAPPSPGPNPPPGPGEVTNQLAVIVDMRSDELTRPKFELYIDGELVGAFDITQSNQDCQSGGLFGECFIGGELRNIESGRHRIRLVLANVSVGQFARWQFRPVAKVTQFNPIRETLYNFEDKFKRMAIGDRVQWTFEVVL